MLRLNQALIALLGTVLPACLRAPPDGPLRVEAVGWPDDSVVTDAMRVWSEGLGDCGPLWSDDGEVLEVRLIDRSAWPHGDTSGMTDPSGIDVRLGLAGASHLRGIVVHELGHVLMGDGWHDSEGAMMSITPGEWSTPSGTSVVRARRLLGCE